LVLLGVVPVLLVLATAFFSHYPFRVIAGHLVTMALLGVVVVELCLLTFQKISFACSYLPGKANLHFVFWAALLASIYWLKQAADFEGRMLSNASDLVSMVAVLSAAAIAMHVVSRMRARQSHDLIFEEDVMPEIVSLKLNQ
jgi:hypothetical protein